MKRIRFHRNMIYCGEPFVTWRLPGEKDVFTINAMPKRVSKNFTAYQGFLVAPFEFASHPWAWLFPADKVYKNLVPDDALNGCAGGYTNQSSYDLKYTSRGLYERQFERLQREFSYSGLGKAVLSRIIHEESARVEDAPVLFEHLLEQYPSALVYLACLPNGSCWIGASPEPLLELYKGTAYTTSLAATRTCKEGMNPGWNAKEQEEQHIVTDYILSLLRDLQVKDIHTYGPASYCAGNLLHLRTNFSFPARYLHNRLDEFLMNLHPTPAVCGMPKQLAYHKLKSIEQHDREFYAGFLGPVGIKKELHFFVNLRCMQLFRDGAGIYAGGGITPDSDVESEWLETRQKARTMLNVIQKVHADSWFQTKKA